MVGIIIVAHFQIVQAFLNTLRIIAGGESENTANNVKGISIDLNEDVEVARKRISQAIKEVDKGEGVLILTDMLGGTPSNLGLSFLEEGKVEVLTGFNLPMLLRLKDLKDKMPLSKLSREIQEYGQRSICLAGEILKKG